MEKDEILSDLETVIFVDPFDAMSESKIWLNGCLKRSAEKILKCDKEKESFILTGQANEMGNAESDGPIGSAVLCHTLRSLGFHTSILTDSYCSSVVISAAKECPVLIVDEIDKLPKDPSFLVSVGRPSKLIKSKIYISPTGDDITSAVFQLDRMMNSLLRPHDKFEYLTVGICDRFEECGAGNLIGIALNAKDLAATTCGVLIMSGTSNWGAIALAAALLIMSDNKEAAEKFIEYNTHQKEMLEKMIKYGSYDSKTGKQELMIDGMEFDSEHESVNHSIITLVKQYFKI